MSSGKATHKADSAASDRDTNGRVRRGEPRQTESFPDILAILAGMSAEKVAVVEERPAGEEQSELSASAEPLSADIQILQAETSPDYAESQLRGSSLTMIDAGTREAVDSLTTSAIDAGVRGPVDPFASGKTSAASLLSTMAPSPTPAVDPEPARGNEAGLSREQRSAIESLLKRSSGGSASVEQLLALGDRSGAGTRALLDAILTHAGTPLGLRLASRDPGLADIESMLAEGEVLSDLELLNGAVSAERQLLGGEAGNVVPHDTSSSPVRTANAGANDGNSTPVRSLESLNPELRARLERVMQRMRNEYGHDVAIVETVRSQERQDWLYEQGRTRPGAIVTWTHNSAHTRGSAADVIIDGKWDNAIGYARLQRIAREEGLHTLGMKDPGHLELTASSAQSASASRDGTSSDRRGSAGVAGVARIAGVAGIASVASSSTAFTSRVTANSESRTSGGVLANESTTAQYHISQLTGSSRNGSDGGSSSQSGHSSHKNAQDGTIEKSERHHRTIGVDSTHLGVASGSGTTNASSLTATASESAQLLQTSGGARAEQVADLQQLKADSPASPITRMTLNVDQHNGSVEQVTIDLRGNTVSTRIATDPASAGQLRMQTASLQDALGRHGLDGDNVRISAVRQVSAAEAVRSVVAEPELIRISGGSGAMQSHTSDAGTRERAQDRDSHHGHGRREQMSHTQDDHPGRDERRERSRSYTGDRS